MTRRHVHLQAEGVSVLLDTREAGLPRVVHWGPMLGELTSSQVEEIFRATSRQTLPATLDSAWASTLFPF